MNKYIYYFKHIGWENILKGYLKKIKLKKLQRKYGFDKWNLYPVEHREYALWIINHINNHLLILDKNIKTVYEIGCGLGEIISNLNVESKVGYDISVQVINAAKEIGNKGDTKFYVGSFNSISNQIIDIMIIVNFTSLISQEKLTDYFGGLIKDNRIDRFIVECVNEKNYMYLHDFKKILGERYQLESKSKTFTPINRWIEVYKLRI